MQTSGCHLVIRPLQHEMHIYCTKGKICIDLRNFNISIIREKGLPGPLARIVNTLLESWQRTMGTFKNAFKLVIGRFDPRLGTADAIQAFYHAIKKGDPSPVSEEDAKATIQLSEDVWNFLERTRVEKYFNIGRGYGTNVSFPI